jgi:Ca-activated chloride channel family protein
VSRFHFANPAALVLLIVVPLLAAAYRYGDRRRRQAISAWGRSPAAQPDPGRRFGKRAMQLAACAALAIALARPSTQALSTPPTAAGGDLVFLLDVSRSMLARDVVQARLYRARDLIREIAAQAGGRRVALVAFAGNQAVQCPLTLDHGFFEEMVNITGPDSVSRGGTRLGDAIRFAAAHVFDDVQGDSKYLVLVSDGEDHESSPVAAAREAGRRGIRIVSLGIGDPARGALVPDISYQGRPVVTRLEEGTLRALGDYMAAGAGPFDAGRMYRSFLTPARSQSKRPAESGDTVWMACLAVAILLLSAEFRVPERRLAQAAVLALAVLVLPVASFAQTVDEWFNKGVKAIEEQRYPDAVRYFSEAASWSPGTPEIRFNLGKALYQFRSYTEAAGSFEMAARSARDVRLKAKSKLGQGNAFFRDAEQLYGKQAVERYKEAVAAYREAHALDPDLFDAELNRKVAERRLQNPPPERAPSATPRPPEPAPSEPAPDAERILRGLSRGLANQKPVKRTAVERDW